MTKLIRIVSYGALALTVVPAGLVAAGTMNWDQHATLMVVGMVIWFATAPVWMLREDA